MVNQKTYFFGCEHVPSKDVHEECQENNDFRRNIKQTHVETAEVIGSPDNIYFFPNLCLEKSLTISQ